MSSRARSAERKSRGTDGIRLRVRVRPGASRTAVGGRYGDEDCLVVAVTARAVDGKATDAVLRAVAAAFDLPAADVSVVTGRSARTKVLQVEGDSSALTRRLEQLLG